MVKCHPVRPGGISPCSPLVWLPFPHCLEVREDLLAVRTAIAISISSQVFALPMGRIYSSHIALAVWELRSHKGGTDEAYRLRSHLPFQVRAFIGAFNGCCALLTWSRLESLFQRCHHLGAICIKQMCSVVGCGCGGTAARLVQEG